MVGPPRGARRPGASWQTTAAASPLVCPWAGGWFPGAHSTAFAGRSRDEAELTHQAQGREKGKEHREEPVLALGQHLATLPRLSTSPLNSRLVHTKGPTRARPRVTAHSWPSPALLPTLSCWSTWLLPPVLSSATVDVESLQCIQESILGWLFLYRCPSGSPPSSSAARPSALDGVELCLSLLGLF